MRVLFVTQVFWPESFLINVLATELSNRGHKITVMTGLPNYPKGEYFSGYSFWKGPWQEKFGTVQVLRIPLIKRRKGFFNLAINYLSFIFFGSFYAFFKIKSDYDLIFFFGVSPMTSCIPAIFIKRKLKIPLINWVQDLWPESVSAVGAIENGFILNQIRKVVGWIYKKSDLILVQSQGFKENVLSFGISSQQIEYVPNWSDKFPETTVKADWFDQLPKGFRIVFAGNIGKAQGISTVLDAAEKTRHIADLIWIFVGEGSEFENLKQTIENKGLNTTVFAVGRKPPADMPGLFKRSDVLLVSLTGEYIFTQTIPSKVQAYMAAAKPILGSLNGEGAKVIKESGAGICSEAENARALADSAIKLYSMTPDEREKLGQWGHQYFLKNFEQGIVIDKIENIMKKLVDQ